MTLPQLLEINCAQKLKIKIAHKETAKILLQPALVVNVNLVAAIIVPHFIFCFEPFLRVCNLKPSIHNKVLYKLIFFPFYRFALGITLFICLFYVPIFQPYYVIFIHKYILFLFPKVTNAYCRIILNSCAIILSYIIYLFIELIKGNKYFGSEIKKRFGCRHEIQIMLEIKEIIDAILD